MKLYEILNKEHEGKKFKNKRREVIFTVSKEENVYVLKYSNGGTASIGYMMLNDDYEEVKEKDTGWTKEYLEKDEKYWTYDALGLNEFEEDKSLFDTQMYLRANKFTTKEKCREIREKETLWRKLQRFADENNNGTNWNIFTDKYYIYYNHYSNDLSVGNIGSLQCFGQVYFTTEDIAKRAIEEFREELKEYFKN